MKQKTIFSILFFYFIIPLIILIAVMGAPRLFVERRTAGYRDAESVAWIMVKVGAPLIGLIFFCGFKKNYFDLRKAKDNQKKDAQNAEMSVPPKSPDTL